MKKTKRILSLLLAVIMVAGLIAPTVLAEMASVTTGTAPQTEGGETRPPRAGYPNLGFYGWPMGRRHHGR